MNILVTAGNTQTPVDRVRCITNIFSGCTGAQVASSAFERGHTVTLLTSHSAVLDTITTTRERVAPQWRVRAYRTFDDLDALMCAEVTTGGYDAVIHAAAVSDYHVAGVFTHRDGQFKDVTAGKVKSSHPELWPKLTPAPKLIDKVRAEWEFAGRLVKFKLEVGVSPAELEVLAEALARRPDGRKHPGGHTRVGAHRRRIGRVPARRAGGTRGAFAHHTGSDFTFDEPGVTIGTRPASNLRPGHSRVPAQESLL